MWSNLLAMVGTSLLACSVSPQIGNIVDPSDSLHKRAANYIKGLREYWRKCGKEGMAVPVGLDPRFFWSGLFLNLVAIWMK